MILGRYLLHRVVLIVQIEYGTSVTVFDYLKFIVAHLITMTFFFFRVYGGDDWLKKTLLKLWIAVEKMSKKQIIFFAKKITVLQTILIHTLIKYRINKYIILYINIHL